MIRRFTHCQLAPDAIMGGIFAFFWREDPQHVPACAPAQVPSDSEMLLAQIKMERRAALALPPLPSTFAADVAAITGAIPAT